MYNIDKYRYSKHMKVKDLIAELAKENPEAEVTICGDNYVHIHVEEDNSIVTLDNEDLESDCYPDIPYTEMQAKEIITQDRAINMLKIITENLCMNELSENVLQAYKDLGFTYEETLQLYNWRK